MTNSEADEALDRILKKLYERRGLDFKEYRRTFLQRRIEARFHALGVSDLIQYEKALPSRTDEWDKLFDTLTINVAEFFRDPAIWQFFYSEILNPLLLRPNGATRIWSAACASGEEPYTIAVLIHEAFRLMPPKRVEIFASDVDPIALQRAKAAMYPAVSVANVSPQRLKIFFTKSGDNYEVAPMVKAMVQFSEHNYLTVPHRYRNMDVVFCRNSMIYLKGEAKETALSHFYSALNPGGWLVLGSTEVLLGEAQRTQFTPVASQPGIFKKIR